MEHVGNYRSFFQLSIEDNCPNLTLSVVFVCTRDVQNMGQKDFEDCGLSTKEALDRLYKDIEHVLNQFQLSQKSRKSKSWIRDAFHHRSQHTSINWIALLFITITIIVLLISSTISSNTTSILFQTVLILILMTICISIELYDNKLRHNEIPRRVKALLTKIKTEAATISWLPENYPHLLSPFSPCITLQWTYRDNKLVNLPWALLVKDDVIIIRPGQISPGYCESLDKTIEYALLHAKEVYGPSLQHANEFFSAPKIRKPLENKKYRLLETPYLNNLRIALDQALDRPVTVQNQQRHFIMIKIIEWIILPAILALMILISCVKYMYLETFVGNDNWLDLIVLTPVATILPLLPLVFPVFWNLLNYIGMARFNTIFDVSSQSEHKLSLFEEQENVKGCKIKYHGREVWNSFLDIVKGEENFMVRSANILHVLGSLTALCCVDKKGILSWPNPSAEKVFFLHNTDNLSQTSSLDNFGDLRTDVDSMRGNIISSLQNHDQYVTTVQEVLDLSYNQNDHFKLHFDDTGWQKHLNSLKPLGLAILLNTCNTTTQDGYTKFCSHITCEAMYNENLIPVTNRRCLCELAKEIGFVDQAQKIFSLEQQLSSYRHLQTEMARRDNKFARSLHLSTKLKFPFPHMFAVIVKENSSGSMQLLSQGTADMILDSCVDYWDGHDLCPLSNSDRKKIQDFYQRCSLTAYCTAFAYRPLHKNVSEKLSQMYLELPSDSRNLYINQRSPTPVHCDCRPVLEPRIKTPVGQFYSTDSLLYNDSPASDVSDVDSFFEMQCNQVFIGMVTMQYQVQLDMVHLIEQLERACIRFVHFSKENELRSRVFSEKMGLESGWNCHISLLSERSRRESGPSECWANNGTARVSSPADLPRRVGDKNTRKFHTPTSDLKPNFDTNSTLDSSKALSYSAPSAINLDHSVVKFDTELESLTKHPCNDNEDSDNQDSQESVHLNGAETNGASHDWQSLSCMTDSTEQSAPINFDMSNRAKLPRGIDKIRPHIENIDNVPLLVSLFTDCTASSTKEMIRIMQDYSEVICVMGSSANYETMGIFMQADASIAVEPLYPQVCQRAETYEIVENKSISAIDLSRALNSVACSLSVKRENSFSLFYLIIEARHYMRLLWNAVQFWLCSCVAVSIMQLTAAIMLPPLLTIGQVLWFCCFFIPVLSISLMGTAVDSELMKKPQGKKQVGFNSEVLIFVLWCYGAKFVTMMLCVIGFFGGILASDCTNMRYVKNCTCTLFYLPEEEENIVHAWINVPLAQNYCMVIISLHLVIISVCFVHREHAIWTKSPHRNVCWIVAVAFLLIVQGIISSISFNLMVVEYRNDTQIANILIIFAFLSPIFTFIINELIKRQEIKTNLRYQRRARLDFGTKLGMNSPF